jgi:hypothetical protein
MKKILKLSCLLFIIVFLSLSNESFSQNIGIGTATPTAKLHIKGSADTSQLVIDANSTQSNTRPLIKLRNSSGADLMWIHSDNIYNTFIGLNAGRVNNPGGLGVGTYNSFIGRDAGYSNTTGSYNTANGASALYANTTGSGNTANGVYALYANSTGSANTANGYSALYSNTTGVDNTANGYQALIFNTTGSHNTAIGANTLLVNTTASYNTANGDLALRSNTTGSNNTAVGAGALYSNTTGIFNTAGGSEALYYNTTGNSNTANGLSALRLNTSGTENTAYGGWSLYFNNTGNHNTAVGLGALYATTASGNNTALGGRAGDSYDMGWNNTLIGANSDVNAAGIFNCIAIGESAVGTGSNQARIGNGSTSSIGGYANWTNISDGRIKKNIQDNVPGLAFISKLKPVTYTLDLNAADRIIQMPAKKNKDGKIIPASQFEVDARKQKEQIVYTGFIAQDVEKAAKELGYDFSGVDAAKNNKDLYGLRYAEFVVPLVKAVQELSKQNEELKKQSAEQKKQNEGLLKRIEKLESFLTSKN